MKKALLILLALTMMMSMVVIAPIGASAAEEEIAIGSVAADYKPEGTAVATAEDFAAMKADGQYYLSADITVAATYMEDFTGTFDGNGHSITTTVTLFDSVNGTVKNLNVNGKVVVNEGIDTKATAVVARLAATTADASFDNICNRADMVSDTYGMASIVGMGNNKKGDFKLTITNCENYGNVTVSVMKSNDSGAIIALCDSKTKTGDYTLTVNGCVNHGIVNAGGRPGGIVGYINTSAEITNCVNNGDVQAIFNYCGGIAGRLGGDKNHVLNFWVENCVNNGNLTQDVPDGTNTAQVGGICGYVGQNNGTYFISCVNNGDVTVHTGKNNVNIAGIMASGDSAPAELVFENCTNNGDIKGSNTNEECRAAGIVARGRTTDILKIVGCANTGDIEANAVGKDAKAWAAAAGIAADAECSVETAIIEKCANSGNVTAKHSTTSDPTNNVYSVAGGIAGRLSFTSACQVRYNVTSGVVSGDEWVAGLVAMLDRKDATKTCTVQYNVVAGELENIAEAGSVGPGSTISANVLYKYNDKYFMVTAPYYMGKNSVMKGTVTETGGVLKFEPAGTFGALSTTAENAVSTYFKYVVGSKTYMLYNTGEGKATIDTTGSYPIIRTSTTPQVVFDCSAWDNIQTFDAPVTASLFWSLGEPVATEAELKTNAILSNLGAVDYVASSTWKKFTDAEHYTLQQIKDGVATYDLNTYIGTNVFFQNLKPIELIVDEYPTTDSTHAVVYHKDDIYYNLPFELDPDCTPATGDATIYVAAALAVSALALGGLVVAKKKKVRD